MTDRKFILESRNNANNSILIYNILVPFSEWIIITIFTSLLFIYYDTYARKSFSEFILIFVLLKFTSTEKRRWNAFHRRQTAEKCAYIAENRRVSVPMNLRSTKMSMNSEKLSLYMYHNKWITKLVIWK